MGSKALVWILIFLLTDYYKSPVTFVQCLHLKNSQPNPEELSSLGDLETKLNLLLDTESHEKNLLEELLLENERHSKFKSSSIFSEFSRNDERGKLRQFQQDAGDVSTHPVPGPGPSSSSSNMDMGSVVQKLVENSVRMESMITMLNDFKTVLTQTISTQEKQMGLKTEVVELREEINYLRQEIQKVKSQAAYNEMSTVGAGSKYQNKLQNNEATMNWLKESVQELRHEIIDVSSSLNITGLLHLKQQLDNNERSTSRDMTGFQKQLELLQLSSDQNNEAILELKGDIADVRTWQTDMGQKIIRTNQKQGERFPNSDDDMDSNFQNTVIIDQSSQVSQRVDEDEEDTLGFEKRLKTLQDEVEEDLEESQKYNNRNIKMKKISSSHAGRHRKLGVKLAKVEKILIELTKDQYKLSKKVKILEQNSPTWKRVVEDDNGELRTISYSYNDENNGKRQDDASSATTQNTKHRRRRHRRDDDNNINDESSSSTALSSIQLRLQTIEKTVGDYVNNVEMIDSSVSGLNELHSTTKSLFTSLESLENKYDIKITDLQTTMAKVEATVSSVSVATDELKEQQNLQTLMSQSCKKETKNLSQSVQTTQLRVASLQNQILNWGLKICENSNQRVIQDIQQQQLLQNDLQQ